MRTGSRAARTLALALCCTAAATLTGCGGPDRDGYAAVGAAAAGPERGAGENVPPQGRVEYQPIASAGSAPSTSASGSTASGAPGSPAAGGSAQGGSGPAPGTPPVPGTPGTAPAPAPGAGGSGGGNGGAAGGTGGPGTPTPRPGGSGGTDGSDSTGGSGGGTAGGSTGGPGGSGGSGGSGGTTPPPATPAALTLGTPVRAAASDRWCERVTVTFTNTGTTAARSGTVGFATHVIGALGIDWATITTTQPLPAPIAGRTSRTQAYTVCVEAWRVPLGMRVETRGVTASWS
ncbi:hypothetical protein ACIRBY_13990 [Streptomyces sp. NPDC096136]|uniref:hypothetical protein n=1 Tax=Streptomyces sp. NPDC096136 TaxID=3366076 RepID=UPI0037F57808